MKQYKEDRNPANAPLLAFKSGAIVHFPVDSDFVYMTTKLEDRATYFLPFNRGENGGAGNPVNPNGYRTAYVWEHVWARDICFLRQA